MVSDSPADSKPPPPIVRLAWFRATDYEIADDMLVPAPGAEIEQSDPWRRYEEGKHGEDNGRGKLPYTALANLAPLVLWRLAPARKAPASAEPLGQGCSLDRRTRTLYHDKVRKAAELPRPSILRKFPELADRLPSNMVVLDEHPTFEAWRLAAVDRDAVLKWVTEYGLLGTLLHGYVAMASQRGGQRTAYARRGPMWTSLPKHLMPRSSGTIRYGVLGQLETAGLQDWHRCLPGRSKAWPRPGSLEFFARYREPLVDLLKIASTLGELVSIVAPQPAGALDEQLQTLWIAERSKLDQLLSMGTYITTTTDEQGHVYQQLRPYSLVGAVALMVYQDLASKTGATLIRCGYCGLIVRRWRPDAEFCSKKCATSAYVRRSKRKTSRGRPIEP